MVAGELKALYVMGEDPVLTDADANHVRKAIASLDFLVVQDIFLTETAKYADVVLPAACYAEKDGTFTNTERRVQRVRKAVEPPGEARADWRDHLPTSPPAWATPMDYDSPADIFEEIRTLTPTYAGMTYDRVDACGLQWPCPDLDHPGTPYLHEDTFPRGRGRLMGVEYEAPAELMNDEYPILLTTGRMLYQYNISTRQSAILEGLAPCELTEINPTTRAPSGVDERWPDAGELTPGLGGHHGEGDRPGAAGHPLHDLPLLGDGGERADQLGVRPDLEDGGVQGLAVKVEKA